MFLVTNENMGLCLFICGMWLCGMWLCGMWLCGKIAAMVDKLKKLNI